MAGLLNVPRPSILRPTPSTKKLSKRPISVIRATSETPISSSTSTSTSASGDSNLEAKFSAPPNFKPPKPQPFTVKSGKAFDVLGAALALFFRLGTGLFVNGYSASFVSKDEFPPDQYALEVAGYKVKETSKAGARPEKPIEIYEFEGCPFCRKVREIVAVLDIDVLFYPCPKNGPTFRPKVVQMGGKQQFPYMGFFHFLGESSLKGAGFGGDPYFPSLWSGDMKAGEVFITRKNHTKFNLSSRKVDPNTGTAMYESDDIMKYLATRYGDGSVPLTLSLGLLTTLTAGFAMLGRAGKGSSYTPSRIPPKPLEIWSYEGSPFCKLVREALVELELPHIQRSCARGSSKRQALYEKAGHFQVPYLEDPNTGIQMFESADIVDYLKATYALQ